IGTSAVVPVVASTYDLVVVAADALTALPETNVLVVAPVAGVVTEESVPPDAFDRDHALARSIDWATLDLPSRGGVSLLPESTSLLSAGGAVLVQARTTANGREVVIGFDVGSSNWPELASFPIFFANLL